MEIRFSPSTRSMLFLAGTFLLPVTAAAQDKPNLTNDAVGGEITADIVVTAQRRAESLQKVPMTVNVVTGEQVEKLNILDFKDVQQLAPGLELTNNDGRSNTATLRGISYNPDSGTTSAVDVYFNDVPVDPQTIFTAIYDVNQIEVLRGPQGVFRGRTSPAGAITLTTRKPDLDDPEGYFQISGSNRNAFNGQGSVSVPLVPGKIALRAAGLADFNKGNQVRNIHLNNKRSNQETWSGRISLALKPTDDIKAVLTYQHLWSDTKPFMAAFGPGATLLVPAGGAPVANGPALRLKDRRSVSDGAPRFTNRTDLITFDLDINLSDTINWATNAAYQNTKLGQSRDLDAFNFVPGVKLPQRVDTPYVVYTLDTRISSEHDSPLNWMIGGFFNKSTQKVKVEQTSDVFGFLPGMPPALASPSLVQIPVTAFIDLPVVKTSWALFGSVRFDATDHLRFEAGLRYNNLHFMSQNTLITCFSGKCGSPVDLLDEKASDFRKSVVTGGASVSYDWNSSLTTYATYGRSFRPRTVTVGAVYTGLPEDLLISKDETSDSFEIGLKTSLLNRKISLNLSAFYQKYKNYIDHIDTVFVRTTDPACGSGICGIPTNSTGNAISRGFEAQLTGRISRNLDLGVTASYVDAHYDNATLPCKVFGDDGPMIPDDQSYATCKRNDRIAQVPKFTANINGEYRFWIGSISPFIRGLVNFRPGFKSAQDNYQYRGFTNVNLYLGARGPEDRWEISAFAKNLLNQARALNLVYNGMEGSANLIDIGFGVGPGSMISGYRGAVISPPREFGVTGRFSW